MSCTRRHVEPKQGGARRGRKQTRKMRNSRKPVRRVRVRTRKHASKRRGRGGKTRKRGQRGGTPGQSVNYAFSWLDQAQYKLAQCELKVGQAARQVYMMGAEAPAGARQTLEEIYQFMDQGLAAIETARDSLMSLYDAVPRHRRDEGGIPTVQAALKARLFARKLEAVPNLKLQKAPAGGWTTAGRATAAYDALEGARKTYMYVLELLGDATRDLNDAEEKESQAGVATGYARTHAHINHAVALLQAEIPRFNRAAREIASTTPNLRTEYNRQVTNKQHAGPKFASTAVPAAAAAPAPAQGVVSWGRFTVESS
jgi:hypothetical protein